MSSLAEIRRVRSMALTPLRFAIEIVTAGNVRPSRVWWATYDVGSPSSSRTAATSRSHTERPPRASTTTLSRRATLSIQAPASTISLTPPLTISPARCRVLADWMARWTPSGSMP